MPTVGERKVRPRCPEAVKGFQAFAFYFRGVVYEPETHGDGNSG